MGKQTCAVMLGFVAIHLAVILSIISISSPEWVSAHTVNGSIKANRTNHCDLGLWEVCCESRPCRRLNDTVQTTAFRATVALNLVGASSLFLGLILNYVFLFGDKMKSSTPCAGLLATLIVFGAIALLSAIVIFGVKFDDLSDFPTNYISELGWSYFVGVAGVVFAWIAAFMVSSIFWIMKSRNLGYEEI